MADAISHSARPRTDTQAVGLSAPADQAFDFIADPENLPRWAVGFCQAIRRAPTMGDAWIVTTPHGEVGLRYVTDRALGVIDFHLSPAPGLTAVAFSRVVPNGDASAYIFTQMQTNGMRDVVFDSQVDTLRDELIVLQALLRARATCPA